MGVARKGSKSVTFYVDEVLDEALDEFAAKTFRTKSNAVEMLLCKALSEVDESIPLPERTTKPRRKAGELLDRPAKKPGRKPKDLSSPVDDVIPEPAPKKRAAAKPKPAAAAAPKRGRPRKTAAA